MAGLGIGAGSSISLDGTTIGKITSIKPGSIEVSEVSLDAFDSPTLNGLPVEDSIPGWVKPGEWELKVQHTDSVYSTIKGKIGTTPVAVIVTKKNGATYTFSAYVKKLQPEINLKELCENTFTLKVNGGAVETFAAGT